MGSRDTVFIPVNAQYHHFTHSLILCHITIIFSYFIDLPLHDG